MSIVSNDIAKAIEILNNEDVVAIPTETVYGLAGNIFSEKAIRRIFEVKKRPLFNPLIVHAHSVEQIQEFVIEFPPKAELLAQAFWPGSLTLVLKKKAIIPDLITAGKDSVAVRIPNHPITLSLLKRLSFPLAAPSANPFSSISPTSSGHVDAYFRDEISMVLEGGECENGLESTIIGFENNEPVLYRLGSISMEEITAVVGEIQVKNKKESAPNAPGMLARHYAPKTRTFLVKDIPGFLAENSHKRIAVMLFTGEFDANSVEHLEILSASGDLKEAASKLYSSLHKLDDLGLDMIVAQVFPDFGLGKSINDRLERATKQA